MKNTDKFNQIIKLCLEDEHFKKEFQKNPKKQIEKHLDIQLPEELELKVIQDTNLVKHIVLPFVSPSEHLSDEELQKIAAGGVNFFLGMFTISAPQKGHQGISDNSEQPK